MAHELTPHEAMRLAAQPATDSRGFVAPPVAGLSHDAAWPRTGVFAPVDEMALAAVARGAASAAGGSQSYDLVLVGVPTHLTSLSPTNAHETPAAVRAALTRYSSHVVAVAPDTEAGRARGAEREWVLDEELKIADAGDVVDPDSLEGEQAARERIAVLARSSRLVVALGGDNSLTVPTALGVFGDDLATAGLVTLDAHHDLRDGRSNGSPVRRLVEAGLDPSRIVQVGIADFANSRAYRERAKQLGITVIHRDEMSERPLREIVAEALDIAGAAGGPIHVDLDADVCDRSVAPGCPASIPGGISAYELRHVAKLVAADPRVRGIDLAEVDATADAADGRTVRLAALCVLEAAAGLALRP